MPHPRPSQTGQSPLILVGGALILFLAAGAVLNGIEWMFGSGDGDGESPGEPSSSEQVSSDVNPAKPRIAFRATSIYFDGKEVSMDEVRAALDEVGADAVVQINYDNQTPNDLVERAIKLCEERSLPFVEEDPR